MAETLDGKLVVTVTSMALFDLSEADAVFRQEGENAFKSYQKARIDIPAQPGVAFNLVRKLLRVNSPGAQLVEVMFLSRNDPFSGLRVFNSAKHYGLAISRGIFTRGASVAPYLRAIRPTLFLSSDESDVRTAIRAKFAAGQVGSQAPNVSNAHPDQLRIALDGDGVLFDDSSERVYDQGGLEAFMEREASLATVPMGAGPMIEFVRALKRLQDAGTLELRLALVTSRNAPAHERAIRTLDDWGLEIDEAMFLGGLEKAPFLREFSPDIFFDDQKAHTRPAEGVAAVAHVPFGIRNALTGPSDPDVAEAALVKRPQ
ncbi:MAG: hypothetical protein AKCLJLPJ_01441 [Fimbriimonadales bacterium]|nr:hypothetical protein [Fimbriimonadales bacterium]